MQENYAARNGETYLFLTDEEQDINREIRGVTVDQSEVVHMIGQTAFGELYPIKKFRYKNRYDFAFDQMVDEAVVGQPSSDIRLRLVTLASGLKENEADAQLLMQSRAGNEAIVLLCPKYDYFQEFEAARRIENYIKQRNVAQLPESIRKIIQGKQVEAKEREKSAAFLLREAIVNGSFYISGERVQLRGSSAREMLDQAMPGLSQAQENERFDLTPGKWARREAAAVASFERAKKELRGVCNMAEMPAVWGIANTLQLMGGYDHRDENQHALLTGAALWIMDQAYAQGKLEELLSLLPERITPMPLCEGAEEPFSAMPLMQHPLYQTADIWHLVRLLANRNAELVRPSMVACSVTDEWTVSMQRMPTEGHPQRQAFEAIMKLIDPDAAARAAARFEEKVWTFTRLALGANQRMEDKLNSLQRHVDVLESKLGRNAYAGSGMRAPVRMPENWALLGKTTPAQERLQKELAAARAKAEAFFEAIGGFRTVLALPNDREHCLEQFKDNLPQDTYEQLLHFSVEDPYETCFAVLYLLDAGSDVPWIYYGALAVTYTALDSRTQDRVGAGEAAFPG